MKWMWPLGLLLSTVGGCRAWPSQQKVSRPFNAVILSLRTKAGYCATPEHACASVTERPRYPAWTINGYWPYYLGGEDGPVNCTTDTLQPDDLDEDLVNDLHLQWPSLTDESDEMLWANEFSKYGTCFMKEQLGVEVASDYFLRASELYERFPIERWLTASMIRPSSEEAISPYLIERAIESHFPADLRDNFQLYCRGDREGNEILQEIRFCFDIAEFPRQCEFSSESCKDPKIWYLQ